MKKQSSSLKICSRGHEFYKSGDCPICPICWPGRYQDIKSDFPDSLPSPALKALTNVQITSLSKLSHCTENEILNLHGMGPSSIPKLREALKAKGLSFKKEEIDA